MMIWKVTRSGKSKMAVEVEIGPVMINCTLVG